MHPYELNIRYKMYYSNLSDAPSPSVIFYNRVIIYTMYLYNNMQFSKKLRSGPY